MGEGFFFKNGQLFVIYFLEYIEFQCFFFYCTITAFIIIILLEVELLRLDIYHR